jgi:hypothetical protein
VAQAGADLDRIAFDLHPPAAAVAELAPRHVAVERLAVEPQARGQPLDDRNEPGTMGLARRCEAKTHRAPRLSAAMRDPVPEPR